MERFRKYIGRELHWENAKNPNGLDFFGVECTYLPDPPEDFDELEFRTGFSRQDNIAVMVAVELGKIKRIMFNVVDEKDPDVVRSLTESQLNDFLAEKGDQLIGFFEYITK